jgi:hypothetical protein
MIPALAARSEPCRRRPDRRQTPEVAREEADVRFAARCCSLLDDCIGAFSIALGEVDVGWVSLGKLEGQTIEPPWGAFS